MFLQNRLGLNLWTCTERTETQKEAFEHLELLKLSKEHYELMALVVLQKNEEISTTT